MTFKNAMLRAVLTVITDCKHPANLDPCDFDFLEAAGKYGASLDKAASAGDPPTQTPWDKPKGDTGLIGTTGTTGNTGPTRIGDSANLGPQGATEIDRGPEPQTIADTLSTDAPMPDVNDGPVLLSTKKG